MRPALFVAVLAALALLTAIVAHRRTAALRPAAGAATSADADKAAGARAVTTAPEPLPDWTRDKPEIVMEGSRQAARAVGSARAGNLALSRSAAEDRARFELAKLLGPRESLAGREMSVSGARVVQTYSAADGTVYVELSAPVHR